MERITRDPLTDMPLTRSVRRCALCVRETSNYCHVCRQFLCNVAPKDGTHRACSTDFHFLRELPSTKRKDIVKRAYRMKPGEREERSRRASQLAASKKAVANDSASVDTASPANELQVEQLVKRRRGRPRKRPRPGTSDEIAVAPGMSLRNIRRSMISISTLTFGLDSGGVPADAQSRNRIDAPADSAPATTSSGHLAGTPARAERPEAVANLEDSRVHKRQCLEASDDVPSTPGTSRMIYILKRGCGLSSNLFSVALVQEGLRQEPTMRRMLVVADQLPVLLREEATTESSDMLRLHEECP